MIRAFLFNHFKCMNISDQKLYNLCKKYGEQARRWRQKFMGLLPEVNKRKLYKRRGFSSIFEFAAKLGGLSQEQVRRVLNLEKRFKDKPALREMLINGEVSINKLARIVSIATRENQETLAEQVRVLSKSALETLVRDENGSKKSGQGSDLQLSHEVKQKLLELQGKGIDINMLLMEFLQKRELEIALEKDYIGKEQSNEVVDSKPSRYISVKIKKLIKKEHGTKCSIQTCRNPSQVIHHTQRFALNQSHDPHFLAPLCKDHHLIAHSIDVKFQRRRQFAIRSP